MEKNTQFTKPFLGGGGGGGGGPQEDVHTTHQNKSPGFLKTVQQKYLFSRMYITLLLKL